MPHDFEETDRPRPIGADESQVSAGCARLAGALLLAVFAALLHGCL